MSYPEWEQIRNSIFTRTRYFPMIDADMPTFMGLPLATAASDLRGADVVIIGAPYVAGWGEYAGG
jgi:agmatinase